MSSDSSGHIPTLTLFHLLMLILVIGLSRENLVELNIIAILSKFLQHDDSSGAALLLSFRSKHHFLNFSPIATVELQTLDEFLVLFRSPPRKVVISSLIWVPLSLFLAFIFSD